MKKLVSSIYTLFLLTNCYSQDWVSQNSNTTSRLNSVHFVDSIHGCAVGNDGTICKTFDGGDNWMLQSSGTTNHITSVHFIDTLIGFAVTSSELLKTTDGGDNWFIQETMNASLGAMFFIDSDTGFVAGKGSMLKTVNGGQSWGVINCADVYPTCFWAINSDTLYTGGMGGAILGSMPTIAKSADGGITWSTFYQTGNYGGFNDMFFLNKNTAFATGGFFAQGITSYIFRKTIDGGLLWTSPLTNIDSNLTSIYFTDSLTGYMASLNGNILKTIDAGDIWTTLNSNVTTSLHSIFFPDSLIGFAVGNSGTILKTTNAGLSISKDSIDENLIIFPNPTSNQLTIKSGDFTIYKIEIIDQTGKKIKTINQNKNTINVDDLTNGVYFINFITNKGTITKKFVKQ